MAYNNDGRMCPGGIFVILCLASSRRWQYMVALHLFQNLANNTKGIVGTVKNLPGSKLAGFKKS